MASSNQTPQNHSQTCNKGLNILQWNCRSISNKTAHLQNYLTSHKTDIMMLQSLNVTPNKMPNLPGYYFPPIVGTEKGKVMVAIYVSVLLTFSVLQRPVDSVDCRLTVCGVTLPLKGSIHKEINILNVYYPNGSSKDEHVRWIANLPNDSVSWLVCGDFNVSNRLWDLGASLGCGEHLANVIMDSSVLELNDGSFTRIGQGNQRDTAIDLSLASQDLMLEYQWETGSDPLQSDHLPIHISIGNLDLDYAESDTTPKFNFSKAKWNLFQSYLETECSSFVPKTSDIDSYLESVRGLILRAADNTIPKKQFSNLDKKPLPSSDWWNNECDRAVAVKRKAMRAYKTNTSLENRATLQKATKLCEEVIEEERKKHWDYFCSKEIRGPQDSSKLWRKINIMKKRYRQPEKPLITGDSKTKNCAEKAQVLADTFAKTSQSSYLSKQSLEYRKKEEIHFKNPPPDNSLPFNADLNITELKQAIQSIGSNSKASGKDPISYQMISHFPQVMLEILLKFFQACWNSGSVPQAWKEALVIGIPKPGKPQNQASSYRPIALTPHMGKLYERIIKVRFDYILESQKILPIAQAGFRKGRNCMEHVVNLVEHVKRASCNGQTTVATFFDIKRAFDSVWHGRLLQKISDLGISGRLYDFIKSFLDNRKMNVKVGPAISSTYGLDMGVPQGSVIAPLLFSIMLHDIQSKLSTPGLFLTLFADDLAIWQDFNGKSKEFRKRWVTNYQKTICKIETYMFQNGFTLSAEKTALMVFTRQHKSRAEFHIVIDGKSIQPSSSVKYLGVFLNHDLIWEEHIKHIISKARKGFNLVKILSMQPWVTSKSLICVVRALVRSRLMYGHEAFFSASSSQWLRLSRVETCALKAALGLSKSAINDLVYQEAGWLPFVEECKLGCVNFQIRSCANENCVSEFLSADFASNDDIFRQRLKTSKPRLH